MKQAVVGLTVWAAVSAMAEQVKQEQELPIEWKSRLSAPGIQVDGMDRMRAIMDSVAKGDATALPRDTAIAIDTARESTAEIQSFEQLPDEFYGFAQSQAKSWEQAAREAFMAAVPVRDRAVAESVMSDSRTLPGNAGRMYIFVSRSMPTAILRSYAYDATFLNATLVVKGLRKGDTVRDYVQETLDDFNSVDGQLLAPLEINPNLFDMFQVDVVPAVVWTNRVGLEDVGAGCDAVPAERTTKIQLDGPNDSIVEMDKPECEALPQSSYYKLTGTVALPYVLDRFEEAGLSKGATKPFRDALADRHANVFAQAGQPLLGNQMRKLERGSIGVEQLPRHRLLEIKEGLETSNVQKGPYGPSFSNDIEDDKVYREWLSQRVRHALGSE